MMDRYLKDFEQLLYRCLDFSFFVTNFKLYLSEKYGLKFRLFGTRHLYSSGWPHKIISTTFQVAIFPAFPDKIYTRYFLLQVNYRSDIYKIDMMVSHHPKLLALSNDLGQSVLIRMIGHWKLQNIPYTQYKISLFLFILHLSSVYSEGATSQ